jgi:hypothetical protein
MKLSLRNFLQPPVTFSLVGPNTLFSTSFSDTRVYVLALKGQTKFQHIQNNGEIVLSYMLIFTILNS